MKKQLGPKPLIMPLPCLLLGTYSEDCTPNAMTCAWTSICCHKPLAAGVAVRHNRHTFANLQRTKAFTLNVPRSSQVAEVDYLGTVSGAKEPDKVELAGLETEKGTEVEAPILTACPINIELALIDQMAIGSHSWFVGEIKEVHVDEEAVEESGSFNLSALDPLLYIPGLSQYGSVGQTVGRANPPAKNLDPKF